jgi:predicted nucleotidyltransferase component of viral defense system
MPAESFLHERGDFKALVETVAASERINDPALVEKDYWIMHTVFGLKQLGLAFELKGGTSLSKGFGIIQRFSEDIDIRVEPFDGLQVDTNPNHEKPQHIESRRQFFDKLRDKIKISGITAVERDTTYDDETLRNAGLRLGYETHFGSIAGLKDGILLEAGFDQTAPNRAVTISSWIVQFAAAKKLQYTDNQARDIPCYNPEYTFVEKVQAVVRKYGQFRATGKISPNFLRHYYDIHQLLNVEAVQKFIGTPEYLDHKKKRFKSLDLNVEKSGAFTIEDANIRKQFESEYSKTAPLYYRGQTPLDTILARIQIDLPRL